MTAASPPAIGGCSLVYLDSVALIIIWFFFPQNTVLEASLQLPSSLLQSPAATAVGGQTDDSTANVFKFYLLAFRNGKFFPSTGNSTLLADGGKRRSVATPVVMAKIGQWVMIGR